MIDTAKAIKVLHNYGRGMEKILIIVNAEVSEQGKLISASPVTERMVAAIRRGIATYSSEPVAIDVVSAGSLWSKGVRLAAEDSQMIYCPLTIHLPYYFNSPAKDIFSACKDIVGRRHWVENNLGYKTSFGDHWLGHLWLPVILTKKDILYAEIIGEGEMPNSYEQPIMLSKRHRQSLHHLARNLLDSLSAIPAVYLIQFSLHKDEIVFDRLWPFPAAPALASLRFQDPDLFTCHWQCLTNQPIGELTSLEQTMSI